jgi:hypothetical protein
MFQRNNRSGTVADCLDLCFRMKSMRAGQLNSIQLPGRIGLRRFRRVNELSWMELNWCGCSRSKNWFAKNGHSQRMELNQMGNIFTRSPSWVESNPKKSKTRYCHPGFSYAKQKRNEETITFVPFQSSLRAFHRWSSGFHSRLSVWIRLFYHAWHGIPSVFSLLPFAGTCDWLAHVADVPVVSSVLRDDRCNSDSSVLIFHSYTTHCVSLGGLIWYLMRIQIF